MPIAAPFIGHQGEVLPHWTDGSDHMNLAYYLVMFDAASDALFEVLKIGNASRAPADYTVFAAETHLVYEREMKVGDKAAIITTIMDIDDKRLHLAHEMFRDAETSRVCLQEIMFINVSLTTRRVMPWSADVFGGLIEARDLHATLPRPAKLGRHIAIPRR